MDSYIALSMHNYLTFYKGNQEEKTKFCEEECLIYAGDLYVDLKNIIVASGTVFREILVWDL